MNVRKSMTLNESEKGTYQDSCCPAALPAGEKVSPINIRTPASTLNLNGKEVYNKYLKHAVEIHMHCIHAKI